nr:MAG TPA: putative periplasmic lipoprotein [Caudoviricetes sp.]
MKWLKQSNRLKHLYIGIISAIIGSILLTAGLAFGKEYADKSWGGKFDWLDILATLLGGIVGQSIHSTILYLLFDKLIIII